MISTSCPSCEKAYQLDGKFAGKKVRCKGCEATFVVPAPPDEAEEFFEAAFEEEAPSRPSPKSSRSFKSKVTSDDADDEYDLFRSEGEVLEEPPAAPKKVRKPKREKKSTRQKVQSDHSWVAGPILAVLAGSAGGIAGALIWGAIAYFAHLEVGYVAWGVGLLVGFCVRSAAADMHDGFAGLIAAGLSVVSILAGKLLAAIFLANWLIKSGKIPGNVAPDMYWSVVIFVFQFSFGFMDVIFFILALGTAYRLGSGSHEQ